MLSIPKALEKYIYIRLREFISDVVMSRGNWRFLLMNLQAQIRGVTKNIDHTQEINPNTSVPTLIPIEKLNDF
jgi:hypothetical protein